MPPPALRATVHRALAASARRLAGSGPATRRPPCPTLPPPARAALAAPAGRGAASSTAASAASAASAATFLAATEAATARLAELTGGYSPASAAAGVPRPAPGDTYALTGGVGAGKSAWARGFIRGAAGEPDLPVPSPTYLLHNVYDEVDGPAIHHFDLYRLAGAGGDRVSGGGGGRREGGASPPPTPTPSTGLDAFDVDRTGLADALSGGVSLIEWADRLGPGGPAGAVGGGGGAPAPAATPAPSVIEVAIDALSADEAAGLAARVLAGDTTRGREEEDGDGGTDLYTDARPRAVRLQAVGGGGDGRATTRIAAVAAAVEAGAGGTGLALVALEA